MTGSFQGTMGMSAFDFDFGFRLRLQR
jgi:hypothetical protein